MYFYLLVFDIMILSDVDIKRNIAEGRIRIDPIEDEREVPEEYQIQPASVDLKLGKEFKVQNNTQKGFVGLEEAQEDLLREVDVGEDGEFVLQPGKFVLARTREFIAVPGDITAFIEGRSSIGRKGLFVENAGWVDPGFEGTITLELMNAGNLPIKLKPGVRICQVVFAELTSPSEEPYDKKEDSKYQGQIRPAGSRIHEDLEFKEDS